MKIETIENILNFLKEKEDKELPKKWFDSIEKLKLIYELENHPDGIQYRYEGDLNLNKTMISKLPNDLYVDGYLNLAYCQKLKKLPDNLHVVNDLGLRNTNITELPNKLIVGYNLYLWDTPLAQKYSSDQIREMIKSKGGMVIGKIHR